MFIGKQLHHIDENNYYRDRFFTRKRNYGGMPVMEEYPTQEPIDYPVGDVPTVMPDGSFQMIHLPNPSLDLPQEIGF
jgi:hypothetical protein